MMYTVRYHDTESGDIEYLRAADDGEGNGGWWETIPYLRGMSLEQAMKQMNFHEYNHKQWPYIKFQIRALIIL